MKLKLITRILSFFYPIKDDRDKEIFGPMTDYDKMLYWYLPAVGLTILPLAALCYLFDGSFDKNKVLFSNDGPLGVAAAQYMQDGYAPGQPKWNDLHWLGTPEGISPPAITNTIYWLFHNPPIFFTVIICVLIFILYVIKDNQRIFTDPERFKRREKDISPERPPRDRSSSIPYHRAFLALIIASFCIAADWSGGPPTDKTWFRTLYSSIFFCYALIGVPLWISEEMEHRDHLQVEKDRKLHNMRAPRRAKP